MGLLLYIGIEIFLFLTHNRSITIQASAFYRVRINVNYFHSSALVLCYFFEILPLIPDKQQLFAFTCISSCPYVRTIWTRAGTSRFPGLS
jgi:hypothetical protein